MVTFLVCLVVVGGAAVAILRVTLDDCGQRATNVPRADRGPRPVALAGTARRLSAFLIPGDVVSPPGAGAAPTADGGPTPEDVASPPAAGAARASDGLAGPSLGREAPTAGAGADSTTAGLAGQSLDSAAVEQVPPGQVGPKVPGGLVAPAGATVAPDGTGPRPEGPATSLSTVVGDAGATTTGTAAVHAPDSTGSARGAVSTAVLPVAAGARQPAPPPADPKVGVTTAARATVRGEGRGPHGPHRPARARVRGRRMLRRGRGAVLLLVLLLALGTVLAVVLAGAAAMVAIGVRAAVGT